MRLYRIDGESQMTMSSNSPPVAPDGAGSWLMNARSLSRLNDSSLPATPPVPPGTPFLPTEKMTATALIVRVVLVPEQVAKPPPTPVRPPAVQIRKSGAGVLEQPSVKRVRMAPWVVKS